MKKRQLLLLIIAVIIAAVYVAANRFISQKGYNGLLDFIPSVLSNSMNSSPALDTLYLNIDEESYEKFSSIRDQALESGIIVNPEDPWVSGKLTLSSPKGKDEKIKVELRLKGKMTDHVKGDKWSFRVKTKKGKVINKMHRFSLQHPGTRNYLYEWVHQQLAREQGMMALNYHFVHFYLNEKDLGIYALEENFDKELAMNNGRALGPIFRFDPDAYWEYRMLGRQGFNLKPEYTTFQSSFIDPMRSYMLKDSIQKNYLEEALLLMNSFREGKISAAEALDIELFAKKYAILDLIGGHHSVDWSDLKFYYNPIRKIIEPIAYESFSAHKINTLIGFDKFIPGEEYYDDFHTLLFSDAEFYSAYVKNLQKFSEPEFMDDFLQRNDSAIQKNIQILNNEFPYKRFEDKIYRYNANVIKKLLDPKYPLHAFYKKGKEQNFVQVANVSASPIVLRTILKKDSLIQSMDLILPPKVSNKVATYSEIAVAAGEGDLKLSYTLLGMKDERRVEVFDYEHPETKSEVRDLKDARDLIGDLFLQKGDTLMFKPGEHLIQDNVLVNENQTLIAKGKIKLSFQENSSLIIKGSCLFDGLEENALQLIDPQIVFLNSRSENKFKNVSIVEKEGRDSDLFSYPALLNLDHSNLTLENCQIDHISATALYSTNSKIEIEKSSFTESLNAIKMDFSDCRVLESAFIDIEKNAFSLDASHLEMNNVTIYNSGNKAVNLEKWSSLTARNVYFSGNASALVCKSGSIAILKSSEFSENSLDIELKSKEGYGLSKINVKDLNGESDLTIDMDSESILEQ